MYSYRPSSTTMATEVIRPSSGTQPQGHRGRVSGSSPLSSAGSSGSHRNKQLLKSYHDFTMQLFSSSQGGGESDSLFVAAVRSGDYERVENLLQRRSHEVVNIDARDRETGNTALMWAVIKSHVKLIRLLLKYGADVTLRNSATETVLELTEDPQIRKLLLDSVLRKGVSPRHLLQAAWQGNVQVVRQLLNEGKILDINCRNGDAFTPLLLVTRDVELFESIGTALESYDPLAVIDELLRHRADPVTTNRESHTALHNVSSGSSQLSDEIALRLMQIPQLANSRDGRSVAPIHVASKSGSVEVVVALLDHGVDVNTRGYAGSTPLHVSASAGQTQVANALLNHGADITLVDDSGNTAVDVAKTKRMKSVLRDAWMEVAETKQSDVLSPVKPPSRMEDCSPRQTRVHSLTSTSPPNEGFGKRMLQKFTDAHKAVLDEEQMLKDIEAGRFTPGLQTRTLTLLRTPSRNSPLPSTTTTNNRAPAPPKTPRVLDPLSSSPAPKTKSSDGSKKPRRSLTFSGRVNGGSKDQRSSGHSKLSKTRSDPTSQQLDGAQVPVTVVGLDLDDSLRDVRFQRILPPGVKQLDRQSSTQSDSSLSKRRGSSSHHRLSDPSISDVAKVYQSFCNKDLASSPALAHVHPIRTSHLLNLEQMHLRLTTPSPNPDSSSMYPTSRSVLPISPGTFGDNLQRQETIFEFEGEDGDNDGGETVVPSLKLSLEEEDESRGQQASLHHRNMMFNIEASRVNPLKDSSDSGQGSSRSTVSHASSSASLVMSSPSPQLELDRKEAAKNRLGIKMTPSATKVPDERIALFQRAQMRLPSLGRASPAVNHPQAQKSKRQTSEESMSVLSMSSISAVMSSDAVDPNDTMKEDVQKKSSRIETEQAIQGRTGGKRKISLEDNTMLLDTRKRSLPSADESKILGPIAVGHSKSVSPSTGDNTTGDLRKGDDFKPRDNMPEMAPSKRQTALVTPLCATKGKGTPNSPSAKSVPNKQTAQKFTCRRNQPVSGNHVKKVAEKSKTPVPGKHTGLQDEKKATLVGVSKPVIRTLEVLPVAKVDSKPSGKTPDNDTSKVDDHKNSKIDEPVGISEGKSRTQSDRSRSGNLKVDDGVNSETKAVLTGKGKHGEMASKTRKEKTASDLVKLAPNLANKKANTKADKKTVISKMVRAPNVKSEGKSAINVNQGTAAVSVKVATKIKDDKGKGKKGKPDAEVKKEITWRISCDDDDSSESDFENENQRFEEEMPVTTKGLKEGKKSTKLPTTCTKTDDLEEFLKESSDAEEVFEEVVFSDEEDSTVESRNTKTKTRRDVSKASGMPQKMAPQTTKVAVASPATSKKSTPLTPQQKTPGMQGSKARVDKSLVNPVASEKQTAGNQQQQNSVNGVPKGKGMTVKKPLKVEAQKELAKSKVAPRGVPQKKSTTEDPQPSNGTSSKNAEAKKSFTVTSKKPVSTTLTSGKGEPGEKSIPKTVPQKLDLKKAVSPVKVANGAQITKGDNKPGATEKNNATRDSCEKDDLISKGLKGGETVKADSSKGTSKALDKRSEVNPAGQDYIDPAVKIITSEQNGNFHLNPTSPKEPKQGSNSFRKGKYKSPDTSPRDLNESMVTERKPIRDPMAAKQSPVIMDIVEMFKSASSGTSDDVKVEVLGKIKGRVASVKGPIQKLVKNMPKKVSSNISRKGGKRKAKDRVGSGGKTKGRVGSGGSRSSDVSKAGKKPKKSSGRTKSKKKTKEVDFRLLPEAEQNTTAFITGQGWSIKTSRNENDDVIIQEGNQGDSSSSEDEEGLDLGDTQLSPHNSLKLDELVVMRSISIEEKKNLVNILSPLEMNAPFFIPDTMGTIKEFADSLKSTSSSEVSMAKNVSNHSTSQGPGSEAEHGSTGLQEQLETHVEPKESDLDQTTRLKNSPPVPDVRVRKSSTQMGNEINQSDQEPRNLALTGELSNYDTNPDLLKVFRLKDHFETASSQGSRRTSIASDEEQVREHLSLLLNKPDSGSDVNEDGIGVNKRVVPEGGELSTEQKNQLKASVLKKKPPLPKPLHQHQIQSSKRSSPRRASDPNPTPANTDTTSSPAAPAKKSGRNKEETKSQVSTIKNSLPDKKFSPPASTTDKKRRGKSLGDAPSQTSPSHISPHPSRPDVRIPIFEVDGNMDSADDDQVEEEEPLTRHVQTLTEKTLQEFETIAQSLDTTTTSVILTRPPSSIAGQPINTARSSVRSLSPRMSGDVINVQGGDQEEREFLNQSLALSESSSEVFRDFNDTGESVQGASMSSSMVSSTDRSLSANTTVSESEGTELLHWKKGNLLGKGAFGMVYCGLTNTGQLLAVKQVELSERDKEKAKQQYQKLQEEVQLLKTLRHKNIVGFLGVSLEDNTVNIFMQFIPGGSIASLLARFGSLDETVFCRYTKQILEGTQYLHENSVIHRDIKGANIMLMSTGVIKLIDFGCAKRLCIQISRSQNVLKSMRGTPYWMAPEVIMETGHGKKSDIWSIGCTVFEMATRKPPWADMPPMAAIFAIGSGGPIPQIPDKFSPDAKTFVNACLTRDQDQRATASELLKHPFIKRRKERGREHYQTRISSTSMEDGPIVFREQPISRDSAESRGRKNYAPQEFR